MSNAISCLHTAVRFACLREAATAKAGHAGVSVPLPTLPTGGQAQAGVYRVRIKTYCVSCEFMDT